MSKETCKVATSDAVFKSLNAKSGKNAAKIAINIINIKYKKR